MKEGHTVKIASHEEYRSWVESHGLQFASVGGDPAELMRMCVENGMFTYSFMRETLGKVTTVKRKSLHHADISS